MKDLGHVLSWSHTSNVIHGSFPSCDNEPLLHRRSHQDTSRKQSSHTHPTLSNPKPWTFLSTWMSMERHNKYLFRAGAMSGPEQSARLRAPEAWKNTALCRAGTGRAYFKVESAGIWDFSAGPGFGSIPGLLSNSRRIAGVVTGYTDPAPGRDHPNPPPRATATADRTDMARASAIKSASPVPTIASACSNPVIIPTAITGMRVAAFTAPASGT